MTIAAKLHNQLKRGEITLAKGQRRSNREPKKPALPTPAAEVKSAILIGFAKIGVRS
jgi:hypothetical protein